MLSEYRDKSNSPVTFVTHKRFAVVLSTRRPGLLGPVGRRPIIANPKLKFNPGSFFFFSKAFYWIISSFLFRASNHQIVDKKNKTEFSLSSHI